MASLGGSVGWVCTPALVRCPVTELCISPTCCRWPVRSMWCLQGLSCPPAAANLARCCAAHRRLMDRPQLVHIGHHVIPNALAQEMKVYAFQHDGYWHVSAAGLQQSSWLLEGQAAWSVDPTAGRLLAEGLERFNPRLLCAPSLITAPFTPPHGPLSHLANPTGGVPPEGPFGLKQFSLWVPLLYRMCPA